MLLRSVFSQPLRNNRGISLEIHSENNLRILAYIVQIELSCTPYYPKFKFWSHRELIIVNKNELMDFVYGIHTFIFVLPLNHELPYLKTFFFDPYYQFYRYCVSNILLRINVHNLQKMTTIFIQMK